MIFVLLLDEGHTNLEDDLGPYCDIKIPVAAQVSFGGKLQYGGAYHVVDNAGPLDDHTISTSYSQQSSLATVPNI